MNQLGVTTTPAPAPTASATSAAPRRFTGKVALVTGAGSGIGRAVAVAYAREGAAVVLAGRTPAPLAETAALIEAEGGTATPVAADTSSEADVVRMVETAVARHGALDVAFNNAGVLRPGAVTDLAEDDWAAMIGANLTGVWLAMKHEIAHMRDNGGGTIVNTSSNLGAHLRLPSLAGYVASKAAVSALTKAAALENIGHGVRINAISPGAVETSMSLRPGEDHAGRAERLRDSVPIGRAGTLAETASAVLWLSSPESGYTVGHDLVMDGGATA